MENALVARLAADALARSNLEEVKRLQLLLRQAEQGVEIQANKNENSSTLTIPISGKQVTEITSIKSDPLTDFDPNFDLSYCYLNLEFHTEDEEIIRFDGGPFSIYVLKNGEQFYLSDEGQIKSRSISWVGRKLKLIIPDGHNSSCEITNPDSFIEFYIDEGEAIAIPSSPTAVVSRDGSVVLKNVPLKQITTKKKKVGPRPRPKPNPIKFP